MGSIRSVITSDEMADLKLVVVAMVAVHLAVADKTLSETQTELHHHLFSGYDKHVVPRETDTLEDTLEVRFGLSPIWMDIDEEGMLVTDMWTRNKWVDYRLRWQNSSYANTNVLRLPTKWFWRPDLTVYNAKGNAASLQANPDNFLTLVYANGEVLHIPEISFKTHCSGLDLSKWPWGKHNCAIKVGSWTHDGWIQDLQFYDNKEYMDMSDYANKTSPAIITNNHATRHVK